MSKPINLDDLAAALDWIGPIDNASGQICELNADGKPVKILFEFACPACSEVAPKNAEEYGNALVRIVQAARAYLDAHQELEAARKVIKAMQEIDRTPVGACESDPSSMPEPCDSCVEMRAIAENALADYDQAMKGGKT